MTRRILSLTFALCAAASITSAASDDRAQEIVLEGDDFAGAIMAPALDDTTALLPDDPHSLIQTRQDFTEQLLRSAENQ